MSSSSYRACAVVAGALLFVSSTGCTNGVNGILAKSAPLPGGDGGQTAYPTSDSLAPVPFSANDWSMVQGRKVTIACDARGAQPAGDAASLATAKELIDRWNAVGGRHAAGEVKVEAPGVNATAQVSIGRSSLTSLSFACEGGHAELAANGSAIPFDVAYVTSDHGGQGPTAELMLTALSLKTSSLAVVLVKPSASVATLNVTSLGSYVGATPAEPTVYNATGPTGTFLEQDYFFSPTAANAPGFYVMNRESGTAASLAVGRFVMQP